ncbi:hypothetical protein M3Y97_01050000 [Aphelenchoides bicaudatus]|nr:hypothetical protein M3Y97_01050000 [Aphelenchoides bicaudatus]
MASKFPYPNNPHVSNELINAANPNKTVFNESLIGFLEYFIGTSVPLFGILTQIIETYLRNAYETLQMDCCLIFLVWHHFFHSRVQCHLYSARKAVQVFGYFTLPIGCACRNRILKTGSAPSFSYIATYFTVCSLISGAEFIITKVSYCDFDNPDNIDFGKYWYNELPNYPPTRFFNRFYTSCIVLSYLLSIYFAIQTVLEIKRQNLAKSNRIFLLQKEIGKVLFAQSLVPLFGAILPIILPQVMNLLNVPPFYYFADFNIKLTTTFPLLNSLSALLFIVPYRKSCYKVLKSIIFIKENRTSAVEFRNNTNPNNVVI